MRLANGIPLPHRQMSVRSYTLTSLDARRQECQKPSSRANNNSEERRTYHVMDSRDHVYNSWKAIVITCTSVKVREALEKECSRLSKGGLLPKHDFLFVVDDRRPAGESDQVFTGNTGAVGSGGATINALLVAIERLSAYNNHTTVNSELVYDSRILVVHHGRSLMHSPGGSGFLLVDPHRSYVPPKLRVTPPTLLQHAVWMATKVSAKSENGVWVTSLDIFLPYSPTLQPPETQGLDGAVVCTVKTTLDHAKQHGVIIAKGNAIEKMVYKMPLEHLEETFPNKAAEVISGLVFLSASLTEQLLGLHVLTPLDRCTYYGTDSGIPPLQVSLYFDLLAPLCFGVEEEEYLLGQCGTMYARTKHYEIQTHQESRTARLQIWKVLQGLKANYQTLDGVCHHYLGLDLSFLESVWPVLPSIEYAVPKERLNLEHLTASPYIEGSFINGKKVNVIDSWIGKDLTVRCDSSCSLLSLILPREKGTVDLSGNLVWQCYLQNENPVIICYGMTDKLTRHYEDETATIFGVDYNSFFQNTGISARDLWPHAEKQHKKLLNAMLFTPNLPAVEQMKMLVLMSKAASDRNSQENWMTSLQNWIIGPRVSLFEAAMKCDMEGIMEMREFVHLQNVKQIIKATSGEVGGESLLPLFRYMSSRDPRYVNEILHAFHLELQTPRPSTSRLLANIADLLGCMARGSGGLRSGPAANPTWKDALVLLRGGNQKDAIDKMISLCQEWIASGHPQDLIRAARHFERASQLIICREVETALLNVKIPWELPDFKQQVKMGEWVEALCPARFDFAGGWSDTPPICYEQGGAVVNLAVKVNGVKPIGARVSFTPEPHIVCVIRDWSGGDLHLTWTELEHLRDYDNPVAQGALVKAVLLCCHVVDFSSEESLAEQLKNKYGSGIEMEVWSLLPKGSGLGGSSLLAGTLIAALAVLFGHPPPCYSDLIHSTLVVEQWLTTGGGWQDQIGGLVGGAKLGVSRKGTPLTVSTYLIPMSKEFIEILNCHLLLLYTGKVRLARNLLQTVIRTWYTRDETAIGCFAELPRLALRTAKALLEENLKGLGECIDGFWYFKKVVAAGCEPAKVAKLMASLRDHCYGMCLAGAGGGGYLYALRSSPNPLPQEVVLGDLSCDFAEVDEKGIEIFRNGEPLSQTPGDETTLTDEIMNNLSKVFE